MFRPQIQILCTLGPASLRPDSIRDERGVNLFRINLSHTPIEALEPSIKLVRSASDKPICLDTEGPQVRCGPVEAGVVLSPGQVVRLARTHVLGTAERLTLRPAATFDALGIGSTITIDVDGVTLRVTGLSGEGAEAVVLNGGSVGSNKAATVDPAPELPALSEKDREAIEIGGGHGVTHYAMSFTRRSDDVALIRSHAPTGAYVIAKIESRAGVRGMDGIIAAADAVLIDRGDLAKEIPLEYVPFYQKAIVRRANRWSKPILVATNLLESMTTGRRPTVSEANDIANILMDGVHGLVLASETAIGIDPIGTVEMVTRVVRAFEASSFGSLLDGDQPLAGVPSRRTGGRRIDPAAPDRRAVG